MMAPSLGLVDGDGDFVGGIPAGRPYHHQITPGLLELSCPDRGIIFFPGARRSHRWPVLPAPPPPPRPRSFYREANRTGFTSSAPQAGSTKSAIASTVRRIGRHLLLRFDIFQANAKPGSKTRPRFFNPPQKPGVGFQPILEPIIFRFEADQHSSWLAVTCNDDFLLLGFVQKTREVIFDFRQRYFLHSGLPNCASHDSVSDFATIANTSTARPETS